jgi:hypothetical protein
MKALSLLILLSSFSALAQGNITPAQQQAIIEEASHRAPAAAEIDPTESRLIMEKLKDGQKMKEDQNKFMEELDQEN